MMAEDGQQLLVLYIPERSPRLVFSEETEVR
jgi:hypothetical protein